MLEFHQLRVFQAGEFLTQTVLVAIHIHAIDVVRPAATGEVNRVLVVLPTDVMDSADATTQAPTAPGAPFPGEGFTIW